MQDQPLSATLPSTREGSRPPGRGTFHRAGLENIPSGELSKGPVFTAGNFSTGKNLEGPASTFGSHPTSASGPISDLEVIRGADLGPTRTMVAQILWSMRGYVSATLASTRPFQEWGIDEIVLAARGSSR